MALGAVEMMRFVVRLGFREITGLHAVTAIWYDARGRLFEVSENSNENKQ